MPYYATVVVFPQGYSAKSKIGGKEWRSIFKQKMFINYGLLPECFDFIVENDVLWMNFYSKLHYKSFTEKDKAEVSDSWLLWASHTMDNFAHYSPSALVFEKFHETSLAEVTINNFGSLPYCSTSSHERSHQELIKQCLSHASNSHTTESIIAYVSILFNKINAK